MSWILEPINNGYIDNMSILTDEELVDLYTLVSYGSLPSHKIIANKLSQQVEVANSNILQKRGCSYEK